MGLEEWRADRSARRVRLGAGEPLTRFRWWQIFSRSLLRLTVVDTRGATSVYAVDVRKAGDGHDGRVRARLYRDGSLVALSTLPARFAVPGGHIEVAVGGFGLRRCHYVRTDGSTSPLTPDPASAEGRRADLRRRHPRVSAMLGTMSFLFVFAGLCITVPQLAETITRIPPVAASIGVFQSPVQLPLGMNLLIGAAAVLGSTERALRMRSGWIDHLAS
ncbi:hypothetical protein SAMN05880545_1937 [Microbacterium sp. RU33B]|nr:hypothetical protein SAMN05880545_1937 [Microbacterium sp. RU33B]